LWGFKIPLHFWGSVRKLSEEGREVREGKDSGCGLQGINNGESHDQLGSVRSVERKKRSKLCKLRGG